MNDSEKVMDKVMDRKKLIGVQSFKMSNDVWCTVQNSYISAISFYSWQNMNPSFKIINIDFSQEIKEFTLNDRSSSFVPKSELIMNVVYEYYEDRA